MSDLSLWLPDGKGTVDVRIWRCMIAVREYDPRLVIAMNNDTGEWCVYIKLEKDQAPLTNDMFPIFGLGRDPAEFPHPDDLKKRLFNADTVRHGDEMLAKMNKQNEAVRKEQRRAADEAEWQAAEAFEWGIRRMSNDISKRRIQVNLGEKEINRRRSST